MAAAAQQVDGLAALGNRQGPDLLSDCATQQAGNGAVGAAVGSSLCPSRNGDK